MRARLERHVKGRAAGARPGRPKRLDLGVGLAGSRVEALAHDLAARRDDDRADHRIR